MRKKEVPSIRHTRGQIAEAERYKNQRDLVMALLREEEEYSIQEVDAILKKYKEGKVK